jgi:hypothetical protein
MLQSQPVVVPGFNLIASAALDVNAEAGSVLATSYRDSIMSYMKQVQPTTVGDIPEVYSSQVSHFH